METFRKTFKALAAGRCVTRHDRMSIASMRAASVLLTRERLALLRAVRARHHGSVEQLSLAVGRHPGNVRRDLRTLEAYGLIRMSPGHRAGTRGVLHLEVPFDAIVLRIAI
jgi:predicted transcriptional regulator